MFRENMAIDDAEARVRGSLSVNAETTCLEQSSLSHVFWDEFGYWRVYFKVYNLFSQSSFFAVLILGKQLLDLSIWLFRKNLITSSIFVRHFHS